MTLYSENVYGSGTVYGDFAPIGYAISPMSSKSSGGGKFVLTGEGFDPNELSSSFRDDQDNTFNYVTDWMYDVDNGILLQVDDNGEYFTLNSNEFLKNFQYEIEFTLPKNGNFSDEAYLQLSFDEGTGFSNTSLNSRIVISVFERNGEYVLRYLHPFEFSDANDLITVNETDMRVGVKGITSGRNVLRVLNCDNRTQLFLNNKLLSDKSSKKPSTDQVLLLSFIDEKAGTSPYVISIDRITYMPFMMFGDSILHNLKVVSDKRVRGFIPPSSDFKGRLGYYSGDVRVAIVSGKTVYVTNEFNYFFEKELMIYSSNDGVKLSILDPIVKTPEPFSVGLGEGR
jgi:hypothetical protein